MGGGFRADFSSVPTASTTRSARRAPAPTRLTPAQQPDRVAAVSTLEDLRLAIADASVAVVTLVAHIYLDGSQLEIAPGRMLTVRGGSCAAVPRDAPVASVGACALDAAGSSRHFLVQQGAALSLNGVLLLRGRALQGGCVLALGRDAKVNVSSSAFSDCISAGDGGALLALDGASATLSQSERPTQTTTRLLLPSTFLHDGSMMRFGAAMRCAPVRFRRMRSAAWDRFASGRGSDGTCLLLLSVGCTLYAYCCPAAFPGSSLADAQAPEPPPRKEGRNLRAAATGAIVGCASTLVERHKSGRFKF